MYCLAINHSIFTLIHFCSAKIAPVANFGEGGNQNPMVYYACLSNLVRFRPILYLLEGSEHLTLINSHPVHWYSTTCWKFYVPKLNHCPFISNTLSVELNAILSSKCWGTVVVDKNIGYHSITCWETCNKIEWISFILKILCIEFVKSYLTDIAI